MCGQYKLRGKKYCSRHSVYEQGLTDLILSDIRNLMGIHVDNREIIKEMQRGVRRKKEQFQGKSKS